MKKLSLLFMCALMCVYASAAELYTVWDLNFKKLTFFYDNSYSSRAALNDKVKILPNTYYWGPYVDLIETIVFDQSMQNYRPTSLAHFFRGGDGAYGLPNLKTITHLDYLHTEGVLDVSEMFFGCESLQSVDLSSHDIEANNLSKMFFGCTSLQSVNLSTLKSHNVKNMAMMFDGCQALTSVTFSSTFNPSVNGSNFSEMFYGCSSLQTIDLSKWTLTQTTYDMSFYCMFKGCTALRTVKFGSTFTNSFAKSYESMFENCTSLTSVDINGFYFGNGVNFWGMFKGCSALTTIKCEKNLTSYSSGNYMFYDCTSLRGNNGTQYSSSHIGADYARPDRGAAEPGYFTTNLDPICNVPTNLQVPAATITSSTASVSWDGTSDRYFIEWGIVGETTTRGMVVSAKNTLLSELEPNTMYRVRVRSKCSESSVSDYTSWVNFTTLNNVNPCTAPTKFQTSNITQTSLTIRWTKGNPSQTNFIVSYKKASESSYTTRNASNNYLNLSGLAPGTEYNVKIEANCGSGSLSDPLTGSFTTLPDETPQECKQPKYLQYEDVTATSFKVTWTPGGTETKWYCRVMYRDKSGALYSGWANSPEKIFTDLEPMTDYTVTIEASCGDGVFSDQSFLYVTTSPGTEGVEEVTPSDSPSKGEKILRDGQLYIIVGDKMYDARGEEVK